MSLEGLQIGRYRFVRVIGSGGMGEVYLAEDARIGQQVAIKVIRTEASPYPDSEGSKEATRFFRREAMAIARLDHPHILPLFDYGEEIINGTTLAYLVMPYRPEGSLTDWLRRRGRSDVLLPANVAHIIKQTADALQHAHERQIIHQDVKPSNLLIRMQIENPEQPAVLLTDFGIAKFTMGNSGSSHFIRGTPTYMAPEQWEGKPTPATDQYALGVMAYALLTGCPPFQGGSPPQLMFQHFQFQPRPPSTYNFRLSTDIDVVLLRALAKKPAERFATIAAFANALQQATQSENMSTAVKQIYSLDRQPTISEPVRTSLAPKTMDLPASVPKFDNMHNISTAAAETDSRMTRPITPFHGINSDVETDPTYGHPARQAPHPHPLQTPLPEIGAPQPPVDAAKALGAGPPSGLSFASLSSDAESVSQSQSIEAVPPTILSIRSGRDKGTRRIKRWWLVVTFGLFALVITVGSAAALIKGLAPVDGGTFNRLPQGQLSAVVTIVPDSKDLKNLYIIAAVMGTPDTRQHQVQARIITAAGQQSTVINATGSKQVLATQAKGILTIIDIFGNGLSLPTGTTYKDKMGIQVATDAPVNIAPSGSNGTATVSAHAVQSGASGNIVAHDMDQTTPDLTVNIRNDSAFSGGQDAQSYTYLMQSDIDGAASSLQSALTPNLQNEVKAQLRFNEQLTGAPQCFTHTTSDHAAGDRTTSATVTVSVTCTGEAYDQRGALAMAAQWLKQDANLHPGSDFMLTGNVTTTQTKVQLPTAKQGAILITVTAEGLWVFQLDDARKQILAHLIAGKSRVDALSLLQQQPGISQANIQLSSGDTNTLPTNIGMIQFVVRR